MKKRTLIRAVTWSNLGIKISPVEFDESDTYPVFVSVSRRVNTNTPPKMRSPNNIAAKIHVCKIMNNLTNDIIYMNYINVCACRRVSMHLVTFMHNKKLIFWPLRFRWGGIEWRHKKFQHHLFVSQIRLHTHQLK